MSPMLLPAANRSFVVALEEIAATSGQWAIIGGLAVWCHLGQTHRPTLDIDTAAGSAAHETLVSLGEPGDGADRRLIGGMRVEVIEVFDPGDLVEDLKIKDRLFVLAHWAAASQPDSIEIRCENLRVTVPVANRAALVACKLHAWLDRSEQRGDKRGSDGLDIVSLLRSVSWEPMVSDMQAVSGLAAAVSWAAEAVLVEQAARVRRLIQVHGDGDAPSTDEIRLLGETLLAGIAEQRERLSVAPIVGQSSMPWSGVSAASSWSWRRVWR